ncbi:MAG: exonuclease subunit SbcD, partial [Lachnospiraceae bacterium]|nr:exonuclease subunit SbcD [Lachnospiraceae bacterium]
MIFLHVADLHLGKVVNDFSMLEDQKFILEQICGMAKANHADAVVIAGDIYDRAIPPGEAVTLLDSFLNKLTGMGIRVVMISGNHDSPERISFGENLLGRQGVHISGVQKDKLTKVVFEEETCETEFVLFPFMKPAQLGVRTSGEAVERMLEDYWQEEDDKRAKNRVLVTHYFVTDGGKEPELSDSETTICVGGLDNVDASFFQGFDYVALGHIHKPQQIGKKPVWYAGSPLKYSFGETS